jgi:hypothetical protein
MVGRTFFVVLFYDMLFRAAEAVQCPGFDIRIVFAAAKLTPRG